MTTYCEDYRLQVFEEVFCDSDQLRQVRATVPGGVLAQSGLRGISWKVCLGVLPTKLDDWTGQTAAQREAYDALKRHHFADPHVEGQGMDPTLNNPLCPVENSPWANWEKLAEVREIVGLDVRRLCPEDTLLVGPARALITDVLVIWALENTYLSYRQGMHELLAPLVHVLEQEKCVRSLGTNDEGTSEELEAHEATLRVQLDPAYTEHDAYALFCKLMRSMAASYMGVEECASQHVVCQMFNPLLKRADPALYEHLTALEIEPQLFALRWVRVCFGREFELDECLLIWDGIFASADGPELHLIPYVCVAMLMFVRQKLLSSDYIGCLSRLKKFPQMDDIRMLIGVANKLCGVATTCVSQPPTHTTTAKTHQGAAQTEAVQRRLGRVQSAEGVVRARGPARAAAAAVEVAEAALAPRECAELAAALKALEAERAARKAAEDALALRLHELSGAQTPLPPLSHLQTRASSAKGQRESTFTARTCTHRVMQRRY
jgi:hypothetical protein